MSHRCKHLPFLVTKCLLSICLSQIILNLKVLESSAKSQNLRKSTIDFTFVQ